MCIRDSNMVVKAPYQDYRLDNFSIWINGSELETKFKACLLYTSRCV